MDLQLVIKLTYSLFSFRKGNMRGFNFKRLLVSIILIPIFILLLINNRFWMLLDYILFPGFRKMKVNKSVFIIAAPRSGTTFLFHQLANNHNEMTTFKLWEIILAPSILQKYALILIKRVDDQMFQPLQRIILFFEDKVIGKFKKIHLISLRHPEEDESLLLWNLSTAYLTFFYPDTNHFDDYFLFDDKLHPRKRNRIMSYYFRCVQRHNYVFNKKEEKYFLSKNPAMMPKVKTLHVFFPNAIILNINRCPGKTIPSTWALSESIYQFFTSKNSNPLLKEKTKRIVIDWYLMADKYLLEFYPKNTLKLNFISLISDDKEMLEILKAKLGFEIKWKLIASSKVENKHLSQNNYISFNDIELKEILKELPFLAEYSNANE